jgi:hypothetical protein
MKKSLVLALLLSGCSGDREGEGAGNQATAPAGTGTLTRLTGLYEGGQSRPPNQLCIIEAEGEARFGLVVWGSNQHSCSGSGTVSRSGETLRFRMAGDETCSFEARISGTSIALPTAVPDGCAYYCGARASLTGASFAQAGTSVEDARKARDLVGDPLCTGG